MATSGYIQNLTPAGERAAAVLTDPRNYGGAIAHRAQPCLVIYGVPVWIMPNGMCRVGEPDAPMIDPEHATRTVRTIRDERGLGVAQAAAAIRRGEVVKVTVGAGSEDPVLLAWRADGGVMSVAIAGWSGGAREPVCAIESKFLTDDFLAGKLKLEVVERPAWLTNEEE